MNGKSRQLTAFLFFCSFSLSKIAAQPAAKDNCIRDLMSQDRVMGMSVAVVKNNKVIYTGSFGYKDSASNTPLTDACIFRIASISKSFSAVSVLQLVEAKKLSLDDDVSDLLGFNVRNPKYPDIKITLRMLLSHRSSLNDTQGYFTLDAINPGKNPDWAKCYNEYRPGSEHQYCNLNYNIIGTIIEKVSGERFDQYVRNHVLSPLRLYGGYNVNSLDSSRFATIYEYASDSNKFNPSPAAYAPRRTEIANYVMGYSTPIFSPTGGMKISAGDLARYMIMHMRMGKSKGKRLLSRKNAKLMQTPVEGLTGYGFAIETTDKLVYGRLLKGHTGSAYGLYSAMYFDPAKKSGFVIISNGCEHGYTDGFNSVIRNAANCLYENFIR